VNNLRTAYRRLRTLGELPCGFYLYAMKIYSIQIETAALDPVIAFYHTTLGLPYVADAGKVYFQTGGSQLVFSENPASRGIYHFAFNIPGNQIREGMAWLERAGIALIANEKGENQIDFSSWNAEAAYFFDPAGNIVELIARRDLQNESEHPFGLDSLMEISEIGIVTDDVLAWNARAEAEFGILPFDKQKPSADFSALGTDMGLFIVVEEGRNWFLTDIPAAKAPLKVSFENDRGEVFDVWF
jgi:catechol 2,3-dioxygenase-like lactoylglutathione lyase family enzyme